MLRNDAEALERGFQMFGGNYPNDIASGLENAEEKCSQCEFVTSTPLRMAKHEGETGHERVRNDIASGLENMDRVCSLCHKVYGHKEGEGKTHGYCQQCMAEVLEHSKDNDFDPPGPATGLGMPGSLEMGKRMMGSKRCMNVAPPGMEDTVRELKKDPSIDNPFAVAWSIYEKKNARNDDPTPVGAARG